jgi:hypothetical protein
MASKGIKEFPPRRSENPAACIDPMLSPLRNSPVFRKLLTTRPVPFPWRLAADPHRDKDKDIVFRVLLGNHIAQVSVTAGSTFWLAHEYP